MNSITSYAFYAAAFVAAFAAVALSCPPSNVIASLLSAVMSLCFIILARQEYMIALLPEWEYADDDEEVNL